MQFEILTVGIKSFQVVVSFRLLAQSRFWNWILVGGVAASLLFFLFFTMTYHGVTVSTSLANFFYDQPIINPPESKMPLSLDMYWVIFYLLKSPAIWLTTLLALVVCLFPYLTVQAMKNAGFGANILNRKSKRSDSKIEFDNYGFDDGDSYVNIRL